MRCYNFEINITHWHFNTVLFLFRWMWRKFCVYLLILFLLLWLSVGNSRCWLKSQIWVQPILLFMLQMRYILIHPPALILFCIRLSFTVCVWTCTRLLFHILKGPFYVSYKTVLCYKKKHRRTFSCCKLKFFSNIEWSLLCCVSLKQ